VRQDKTGDFIAVSFDTAGYVGATYSSDYDGAVKCAAYYRSIGRRARVMTPEQLADLLFRETAERRMRFEFAV